MSEELKLTKEESDNMLISLYEGSEDIDKLKDQDVLNFLLDQEPPKTWLKKHPYIKRDHYFLPIDKVEWLLKRLFKTVRVEVLRENVMFNSIQVTVRIHYYNIATKEMDWTDGVGACEVQTDKGESPGNMAAIKTGAVSMALPVAKSYAIKDAAHLLGNIFGRNLNRKDVVGAFTDDKLMTLEKTLN